MNPLKMTVFNQLLEAAENKEQRCKGKNHTQLCFSKLSGWCPKQPAPDPDAPWDFCTMEDFTETAGKTC